MDEANNVLQQLELKLEDDITNINKEILKTRKRCVSELDKVSGMVMQLDEKVSNTLDTLCVKECAAKRRIYVKLALLGQKMDTVSATKRVLDEVLCLGIPKYIESSAENSEKVEGESFYVESDNAPPENSSEDYRGSNSAKKRNTNKSEGSPDQRESTPSKHAPDQSNHSTYSVGDYVLYRDMSKGVIDAPLRAYVLSTFQTSCIIRVQASGLILQVPYSMLSY